jgi:hypothetical protein
LRSAAIGLAGAQHDETTLGPSLASIIELASERCGQQRHAYWHYIPVSLYRDELASGFQLGPIRFLRGHEVEAHIKSHGSADDFGTGNAIAELSKLAWVAAVQIPLTDILQGSERAKRLVKVGVFGLGLLTGDQESPARLRVLDELQPAPLLKDYAERGGKVFLRTRAQRLGVQGPPGFVRDILSDHVALIQWLGDCLSAYAGEPGKGLPVIRERWLGALYWYGLGQDEIDDFAAVVNNGAALDMLLGENGSAASITEGLCALFSMGENSVLVREPPMTVAEVSERLYGEGRSRAIHGGAPTLSTDFKSIRNLGRAIVPIVLVESASQLAEYAGKYTYDVWFTFRRTLIERWRRAAKAG